MKYTFQVLLENKLIFTFCITQEVFSPETWTLWGVKLIFFFLIATWLLNSSKWQPIQKVGRHFQRQTKPFVTLSAFYIDPPKLSEGKDL